MKTGPATADAPATLAHTFSSRTTGQLAAPRSTEDECCYRYCSNSLLVCAVLSPPSRPTSVSNLSATLAFQIQFGCTVVQFCCYRQSATAHVVLLHDVSICVSLFRSQFVSPSTTGSEVVLKCSPALSVALTCLSCSFRRCEDLKMCKKYRRTVLLHAVVYALVFLALVALVFNL